MVFFEDVDGLLRQFYGLARVSGLDDFQRLTRPWDGRDLVAKRLEP
jgi:hypothetical protein